MIRHANKLVEELKRCLDSDEATANIKALDIIDQLSEIPLSKEDQSVILKELNTILVGRDTLKVNVAIEVTQKDTDFPKEIQAPKSGGHGHGAAPAPVDPMEAIQKEMNQYKPAIRDAVITNLSSKTSAELASAAGKELAKEQISNDINSILGGEREVLRVSFGQFIIQ